jgi:hypothetical protein
VHGVKHSPIARRVAPWAIAAAVVIAAAAAGPAAPLPQPLATIAASTAAILDGAR